MAKKSSASGIELADFEDLFRPTTADPDRILEDQIVQIPLEKLVSFHNHPFLVLDDDAMDELAESIRENGILTPLLVRKIYSSDLYEVISGHRRRHVAEMLHLPTVPVIVRRMTDDEAVIAMVNAKLQREFIRPSEKAKSYRMKYDAMKHQGKSGGKTLEIMKEESGDARMTIHRLIRLSYLSDDLLSMVDDGRIGILQGVNLSYLNAENQTSLFHALSECRKKISIELTEEMKRKAQTGELTDFEISMMIFSGLKHTEKKKTSAPIKLNAEKVRSYFGSSATNEYMEQVILDLLEKWKNGGMAE